MLDLDNSTLLLSRLPIIHRETGQRFNFRFRYNQLIAKEKMKVHQKKIGGKIRVVFVKARRVGVSSAIDAFGVCHIAAIPNARAKIVSCLAESSKELFDVPINLVKGWPFPLPEPLMTKITYPHKGGDSIMSIMTAQTAIAGRGSRCTFLHLSEAAFFPIGAAAFTSLFNAVPVNDPNTAIAVESTAYGKVGIGQAFWEFWEAAVRGDTEFLPVFLTWLDDPDYKLPPHNITLTDLNEDEKDILSLLGCREKCGRCEDCYQALSSIAWRRWAVPNLCKNKIEIFRQEYPITAEEAFYASTAQAFERDELRYARECVSLAPSPITGRLEQEIDGYGNAKKGKAIFKPDPRSPLTIWRPPVEKLHYYIGVDCARGIANTDDYRIREGKDYAAISVYCGETGEQCLRYTAKIGPEPLAALLFVIASYYNNAMVAIELTGNLGLWAQTTLRDRYRYRNFYRWKGRDDRLPTGYKVSDSIGFENNMRTRQLVLEAYRGGLHSQRVIPYDPLLIQQMEAAEMLAGKWEVPDRIHDDVLISNMVAWICKEQWHTGLPDVAPKLLLGEETKLEKDELENAKEQVRTAKGDVENAVAAHWRKMMRLIQAVPKLSQFNETSTPNPRGTDFRGGPDRLAGI